MSIPTSLIVVVLVLAWLVVLVPMVARRREAVPEAEMAGGTFRVLRRSGETSRRGPAFRRRTERAAAGREDLAGEPSDDQELDEELLDQEYDDADGNETDGYDGDSYYTDEYDTDEYDEEYDGFDNPSDVPAAAEMSPGGRLSGDRRSTGSHPYQPVSDVLSGSHPYRPAARRAPVEAEHDPEQVRYESTPVDRQRFPVAYDDEGVEEHSYRDVDEHPANQPAQEHVDDLHLRPIPRRAGRGGYDPDAAELARRFKYSRRRRVAVVLLLAALLFSAAAVLVDPVLWAGTAVFGLLLIGYLAYLRRQVQIEASIRERRLARLRRARQIRPEYDMDRSERPVTGDSFARNAVPASQVPPSGYRRGRQIVDLDDDDPSFDDLEYYQPLTYRRASGQ